MNKVKWCFLTSNGLKIIEPNLIVSNSYLSQAEKTLSKVKELIDEEDFIWASARIYYCAYYLISSFLQKIGVKSENHNCSIELIKYLFEDDFNIELFKKNRIDSQYYFKFRQKKDLLKIYSKVKLFYLNFKEKIEGLKEKDVKKIRIKIKEILK